MASMKPHCPANQLLWALALVVVVELIEVLQLLQPKQETYFLLLCFAVPPHHVGSVLDVYVSCTLALHRWLSRHPHGQSQQMQENHALSLMLLKSR